MRLLEVLGTVKSKTKSQGRSYKISSLLGLIILGFACNNDSIESISRFGKDLSKTIKKKLGFSPTKGKMPCANTLRNAIESIVCESLEEVLLKPYDIFSSENKIIDIDGKTLKGSTNQENKAFHMLSAFVRNSRIVKKQVALKNSGKEIPSCLELLDSIEVKGNIFVLDAAFMQRSIVNKIAFKEGGFVINVKNNQENLKRNIKQAFDQRMNSSTRYESPTEKAHGRIERRSIEIMDMPWEYNCEWQNIKQIACVSRFISRKTKGIWKDTEEVAYLAINLINFKSFTAEQILDINRGHWLIENQLHWVKDKVLREDEQTVSKKNSCCILSTIRNFIIFIISKALAKVKESREKFGRKNHLAAKMLLMW